MVGLRWFVFCLLSVLLIIQACSPVTTPCQDECKSSSTPVCENKGVKLCVENVQTGCFAWSVLPCKDGESCKVLQGKAQCGVSTQECNDLKARRGCFEKAVYWFDNCGNRQAWIENCANGCEGGKCKTLNTCPQECAEHQTRCQGELIQRCKETKPGCFAWEVAQLCSAGQLCNGSACQARTQCKQECKRADIQCFNNGLKLCVEWKPGCFAWAAGKKCGPDESCQAGSCVPRGQCPTPPACTLGARDCQANTVRQCSNNAQGCPEWKTLQTCPTGQSCQAGQCKAGCSNACTAGQKRCSGNGVQSCVRGSNGCTVWGGVNQCPSGQSCQSGVCKSSCPNACAVGAKSCSGNTPMVCQKGSNGCGSWVKLASCNSPQICGNGQCVSPGDPATRSQSAVCTRWKADYPEKSSPQWKSKGNCDPGTISEGSIQDGLRRTNLYRWMVGLPPVSENKALRAKMQACAVLEAENTPFQGGVKNPHHPQPSAKCYSRDGASMAGSSNLSWGVGSPAQSVDQYMADRGVASLGHRLWLLSPRLGSTAFGHAKGAGRYRTASCQHVFGSGGRARPDFVAYPPQGFVPMGAMRMGRASINDWSFTSNKYRVNSSTKVTLTRLSDNNVQTPKVRSVSSRGGLYPGIAFVPRFPKAGESYKVQIGSLVSYTVKFVNCP